MPSAQDIALIRVQLDDAEPAIWRRFAAPVTTSLKGLHDLIQAAMGWQDYHLWQFETAQHRYGVPDPEFVTNPPISSTRKNPPISAVAATSLGLCAAPAVAALRCS